MQTMHWSIQRRWRQRRRRGQWRLLPLFMLYYVLFLFLCCYLFLNFVFLYILCFIVWCSVLCVLLCFIIIMFIIFIVFIMFINYVYVFCFIILLLWIDGWRLMDGRMDEFALRMNVLLRTRRRITGTWHWIVMEQIPMMAMRLMRRRLCKQLRTTWMEHRQDDCHNDCRPHSLSS